MKPFSLASVPRETPPHSGEAPRSPNIERVWVRSHVTKTKLAEHMWPSLEAKMLRALENDTEWPPVFKIVGRARELVFRDYGVNMSLRRYPQS